MRWYFVAFVVIPVYLIVQLVSSGIRDRTPDPKTALAIDSSVGVICCDEFFDVGPVVGYPVDLLQLFSFLVNLSAIRKRRLYSSLCICVTESVCDNFIALRCSHPESCSFVNTENL